MPTSLLARLADFGGESFEVGRRERAIGHLQQGDDGALGGSVEEGLEQMIHCGDAGAVPRHGGDVDVARAVLLVAHVALFLEHVHGGANGGVAGRIGDLRHDVGHRCLAVTVEHVHDLPFAAGELGAELGRFGVRHG